ncbi:MAG TPA: leucyl/phenylalanyl-tRNA--protein transferase [Rubrivivax sp.]|mgnify:CR=1 FL=1|nr:leucyl/phenylalanyl-tRNA--protein transferase [Rubrivivax sp.]HPP82319.1 leucyl/phenylalanyl-tRNA--protein transferase [Rubrivivax sp.]
MLTWLDETTPLPPTSRALGRGSEAPGLVAAGGGIDPKRLEEAYRKGIFPWYSAGQPVLWWSPDPRMVLPVAEFRLSRSLRKTLERFRATPGCELRIDSAFERVIESCALAPRAGQDGTWIVPALLEAYVRWHAVGRVHSFETWIDGELAGGLYFVAIGRMVFGESMFARRTDASKIALAALVAHCRRHGIALIDCQQNTPHLASLGAREISRADFEGHLARVLGATPEPQWNYDETAWSTLGLRMRGVATSRTPQAPLLA